MKKLYAPWRNSYTKKVTGTTDATVTADDCVFCQQFKDSHDTNHYILGRYNHCILLLNLYPYNAGHLLLLPIHHYASLSELTKAIRSELMELSNHAIEILKKVLGAQGVNTGLNLGKAAGAGIPSHLHMHIVPRWFGDTNFFPVISETKQVSTDLNQVYHELLPHFQQIDKTTL